MRQVAQFVAPGGVLFITTNNGISALSETLRQLQAHLFVDKNLPIMDQVSQLLPVFEDAPNSLKGMSRPHEDWILDQILQPFIGSTFSIEEAIRAVDSDFDVYASSPHFLTDWTWYKEAPIRAKSGNELAIESFRRNNHNFLDYRFLFSTRPEEDNMRMNELVEELTECELRFVSGGGMEHVLRIQDIFEDLVEEVRSFSVETAESLEDFHLGLSKFLASRTFPNLTKFKPFFGRGQQYLSFVRKQ